MTSTRLLIPIAAVVLTALTGCGPAPAPTTYAPPPRMCVGPEVPDDIEDLFDRDVVRHPDSACPNPARQLAWVDVYGPLPAEGESVDSEHKSRYIALVTPSRPRSSTSRAPLPAPTRAQAPAPAPRPAAPVRPAPVRPAPRTGR